MLVAIVKTYRIHHYEQLSLQEVLVDCLPILAENTVVAITAKMVSLCEGNFVYSKGITKAELPAGIYALKDIYILPPSDPQYTANRICGFLAKHYGLKNVGVIITDATGRSLAHAGVKNAPDSLAAAATLAMGEGGGSGPFAVITEAPFVEFA